MHGTLPSTTDAQRLDQLAAAIKRDHAACEALARRSLERALAAGEALLEAKRLLQHGGWLPWCRQLGVPQRSAQVYMKLASNRDQISQIRSAADLSLRAALQAIKKPSDDYWTPKRYADAVRQVLGGKIDLDPASCSEANKVVKAARIFTRQVDGLAQPWQARTLYLNPPYGGQVAGFTKKLIAEYQAGNVAAAICMLNADHTDSPWWRPLWNDTLLCFCFERVWFDKARGQAPFNSVFILFGGEPYRKRFKQVFGRLGTCVVKV
jgi:hypothetical protein